MLEDIKHNLSDHSLR